MANGGCLEDPDSMLPHGERSVDVGKYAWLTLKPADVDEQANPSCVLRVAAKSWRTNQPFFFRVDRLTKTVDHVLCVILHFDACGRHSHEAHHPSRRSCGSCKCTEFYSAYGCVVCESHQVCLYFLRKWLCILVGRYSCHKSPTRGGHCSGCRSR